MAKKELPPIETLRKLFRYEPETGKLYWMPRTPDMFPQNSKYPARLFAEAWNTKFAGKEAGTINLRGYRDTRLGRKSFLVHRIIWAMHHGVRITSHQHIDHINHDRADNRITNLRLVTKSDNARNYTLRADNTSGQVGVKMRKKSRTWMAQIEVDKKRIHLGSFASKSEAITARKEAERKYGYHANHGC